MEFEELKVEIPVDDEEKDEKEFPFNLVSNSSIVHFTTGLHNLLKYECGFLLYFAPQERRYENKSGCFVTGFDVTSKVSLYKLHIVLTLLIHFIN